MRTALGHSLTVEQQTLTLYIAVRIRVPQPRLKNRPIGRFLLTNYFFDKLIDKLYF